ncbi:MAG: DUF5615 family PIN-like protein, partial [Elainella sp.]
MKLLLDENLSDRIVYRIIDLYPGSEHVKTLVLTNTSDDMIWSLSKISCQTSSPLRFSPARRSILYITQKEAERLQELGFGCQLHTFHQLLQLTDAPPERFHPWLLLLAAH